MGRGLFLDRAWALCLDELAPQEHDRSAAHIQGRSNADELVDTRSDTPSLNNMDDSKERLALKRGSKKVRDHKNTDPDVQRLCWKEANLDVDDCISGGTSRYAKVLVGTYNNRIFIRSVEALAKREFEELFGFQNGVFEADKVISLDMDFVAEYTGIDAESER